MSRFFGMRNLIQLCLVLAGVTLWAVPAISKPIAGESKKLGKELVTAFAEFEKSGAPRAIGVRFTGKLFAGLPPEPNTTSRCFDLNGDGTHSVNECEGDTEVQLSFPKAVLDREDIPFGWAGMNWNPAGHPPPKVYGLPHFDFHFYMVPREEIAAQRPGKCGFFMHCDDFKRATVAVPAKYMPDVHKSVGAAVQKMGDHYINMSSREFENPPKKFTYTFIYGAYDGHITFYEPMVTVEHFMTKSNRCNGIKKPQAWERAGYYPTMYCIRYWAPDDQYSVTLERFVKRLAE